ncbi:MAG: PilN domain-containing protein [bacterium]
MHLEINLSQHRYEKKSVIVIFYAGIFFLISGAVFYNYKLVYNYEKQLTVLNERNSNLNKELEKTGRIINEKGLSEKDLKALSKKVNYVNTLIEKQEFSWTGLIYHLEERTPDEISITEIIPSFAENNIKIIGLAKTIDDIVKFVDNLQLSGYFKDVFLSEHSNVEIEENDLVRFVITAKYNKE